LLEPERVRMIGDLIGEIPICHLALGATSGLLPQL